ncbi:hypothetical protein K504DRAFT_508955 [Pleomassaria siparia CBS 279.74]|uniref:USP domain-containing protein n=1 Tax=Pleomassaria siparia CBS 279.74 TaxID=1314801 RepID=A0A6G1JQL2_9PLEO|nr:hypothetical protein K504DRAFT_508955 [Pleomassaria siparia CBS 279.74]
MVLAAAPHILILRLCRWGIPGPADNGVATWPKQTKRFNTPRHVNLGRYQVYTDSTRDLNYSLHAVISHQGANPQAGRFLTVTRSPRACIKMNDYGVVRKATQAQMMARSQTWGRADAQGWELFPADPGYGALPLSPGEGSYLLYLLIYTRV